METTETTEWRASDRARQTVGVRVNGNRVTVFVGVLWRKVNGKAEQTTCGHSGHSKRSSAVACAATVAKRMNRTGSKLSSKESWRAEMIERLRVETN